MDFNFVNDKILVQITLRRVRAQTTSYLMLDNCRTDQCLVGAGTTFSYTVDPHATRA